MLEGAAAGGCSLRRFQEPGHAAQRPQFGHQRPVVLLGPRDPGRERGRPPPLAPEQQPPHVAAPERVPLSQQGQLGAVGRAVRAQLGGPEASAGAPRARPARACRRRRWPGRCCRVGLQGPGEPATLRVSGGLRRRDRAARSRCRAASRHRAPAQRDPAGQQVRLHGLAGPGRLEAGGDLLGVPQQPRRNARPPRTGPGRGGGQRAPPRCPGPAPGTAAAPGGLARWRRRGRPRRGRQWRRRRRVPPAYRGSRRRETSG